MGRTIGSSGPRTEEAIRKAGLGLIYKHGYEGMTLRGLAKEVGIQSSSVYRYFPSKQDLLIDLLTSNMVEMLRQWDEASSGLSDARERLEAFVTFHIGYHTARRQEVFICTMELRSLELANYRKVVGLRRSYERQLVGILEDGVGSGVFRMGDPHVVAFGILAMLTGVCAWFKPGGRMGERDLIETYVQLICHGLTSGNGMTGAALALPAVEASIPAARMHRPTRAPARAG